MKLYYKPAVCSMASHIVLNELGLPHALDQVDLDKKTTQSGEDFFAVSKMGLVPVLELDDGFKISEGAAIMQYLADQKPEAGLLGPVGSKERAQVLSYTNWVSTELHKSFKPIFKNGTEEEKQKALNYLTQMFAYINEELGEGPYLTGETFTIADAYLYVVSNWANFINFDLSGWTHLTAFLKRVAERPAVQKTHEAEGLKRAA